MTASSASPGGPIVIFRPDEVFSPSAGPEELLREMQDQDGDLVLNPMPLADALGAVPALPTLPSAIDQLVLVTVAEQAQSILPSLIEPAPGVLETGLSGIIDEESMNQTTNPSGGNFPGGREGRTRESHSAELRVGSPLSKRAK